MGQRKGGKKRGEEPQDAGEVEGQEELPTRRTERQDREEKCLTAKTGTASFIGLGFFDEAEARLRDARRFCGDGDADALARLKDQIEAKKKAAAEKAAARERDAVADFPEDAATLRRSLKEATAAAGRNDVESVAMAVTSARTILDLYKGTSVEKSAEWAELDAQQRALQQTVQPYLNAQRELVERVQKDIADRAAQRRPRR